MRARTRAAWCLAGLALVCSGCRNDPDRKLRVGVIDTTRILQEMPQYKDLQAQIQSDKSSFLANLPDPNKKISPQEAAKVQEEAASKQRDWEKLVMDLMKTSVQKITETTAEVARQRDLDMVVINTPATNVVYYYAGQDVTLDVLLKLQK
jgi:Skp family chaperone for outer membrane proteins